MANKKNYPRNTLGTWPWDTGFPEGIPGNFVKQQPYETTTLPTRFTPQIASDSPGWTKNDCFCLIDKTIYK